MIKLLLFFAALFSVPFILLRKTNKKSGEHLLAGNKFLFIAHRGASAHAPENTMEAFRLAKRFGADFIELDVHLTKDGHLIAMHDLTVDRTTDGTGRIRDLTLEEIKRLDAGSWFDESFKGAKVPTLEEIFQEFGTDVNYKIEIKHPDINVGIEAALLRMLETYRLMNAARKGKVIIQSFDEACLKKLHGVVPSIPLFLLIGKNDVDKYDLEEVKKFAVGVGPNYAAMDESFVKRARNLGLLVHPFTVNDAKTVLKLQSYGITGIITDNLELIAELANIE